MKKILILLSLAFTVNAMAQTQDSIISVNNVEPIDNIVGVSEIVRQSIFDKYPFAYTHAFSDPFAKTKLMIENYETVNRIWQYQNRQITELIVGGTLGAIGLSGIFYSVNMPTPVRQVNNPSLDPAADKARRDRRIVGASSTVVAIIGGTILTRSFRWHHRGKAEVGLASLKLEYNLTGNRSYFNGGKSPRKLTKLGMNPKEYKKIEY